MRLISLSIAWLAGIYTGYLIFLPFYVLLPAMVIPLIVALLWHKRQAFLWSGLCLAVLFTGIGFYQWTTSEPTLSSYNEKGAVEIRGTVDRDPELEEGFSRLSVSAQEILSDSGVEEVSGKLLIYTESFPYYSQGDLVQVSGELESLSRIEDPDYRDYLIGQDYYSTMSYPEVEFIKRGELFNLRNRLAQSLDSTLAEPQSSLAQALLLGIRNHIPDSLSESFRYSGTSHLMAISGLHVAILAGIVLSAGAWLFGRHWPAYILIAFGSLWLYVLLTGMRPPAFRAAIMFSLLLMALWLGRPRSAMPSLTLAAAIMAGIAPQVLRDVSFQLSFVAIAGLILLFPIFQQWGRKTIEGRERGSITLIVNPIIDSLSVTLAATIATLPLIAYYFGYISLTALPATFFALLALPGAIILTLLTTLFGLFAPPVSSAMGWMDWLFLSYIIEVVQFFGSLEFAKHDVAINAIIVWSCYGMLLAFLWSRRFVMSKSGPVDMVRSGLDRFAQISRRFPRRLIIILLFSIAALLWLAIAATSDNKLEVNFIDVGQGDAILIQTPSGQQILVDGGPDTEEVCLALGDEIPYWDKSLDLVVLTHPDDDHISGLIKVLRTYEVAQVLEPGIDPDTPAYEEWLRLIEEKDIERTIARTEQQIDLGDGVIIDILHPCEELMEGTESDTNNNSVVLRLEWDEISFLLTGDICEEAEHEILYRGGYQLDSTVLKIAHHGSDTSTSSHFLAAVDPVVAVISVGKDNAFGHPGDEVLARLDGIEIYRTDEDGTITFTSDGKKLWVETK